MPLAASAFSLIAPFVVPWLLFLAGVVVAGLVPLRQRTRSAAVVAELGAHAAGWIAVFAYAAMWIPRARKLLQDFGIEVSSLQMLIIQIADLVADPVAIVIISVMMLAADGIVYSLLWRSDFSPLTRKRFSLFMTLIPAVVILLFGMAIIVPLYKLVTSSS